MNKRTLFEHRYRDKLWRLDADTFHGELRLNWRAWFEHDGVWKPTRQGCIIPIARAAELAAALASFDPAAGFGNA